MKASELRIGNLVNNYYKGHIKVNLSDINNIYSFDIKEHQQIYEPIQLTEEILLKCGFTEQELSSGRILLNQVDGKDNGFIISKYTNRIVIYTLHQLQNIHFALTNEELTVNL